MDQYYEVSGLTDMTLYTEGAYSGITNDPFAKFQISGITKDDETFTFDTSFKLSDPNFISKVLGQSNFGKDRNDVPIMVEELYYNLLNTGYREGKIRGLNTELISFNSAREDSDNTGIGWYLDRYQTPDTPYVVSELRGNEVFNLFKFISISDGSGANREIKLSIANISFNNLTFDIIVRDFYDTDSSPVVLEKFTNCTMDPKLK